MKRSGIAKPAPQLGARWIVWARRLFIPIAVGFLAYSAYHASSSLAAMVATMSIPRLLAACLCWSAAQWVGPLATAAFARALGLPLSYRELSQISILRLPAKYLPGGIWQSVARHSAYRQKQVKNADSLTILVVEHLIALGVSATLGAGLLLGVENSAGVNRTLTWVVVAGLTLVILPPIWITTSWHRGTRSLVWMGLVVAAAVLFWSLAASAFFAYWTAVFDPQDADVIRIVSCYLLSWAAGFVAIFAPQGLGVFEWTAARLLPTTQALSVTVTAVAGFRLITIAGDLLTWVIGLAIAHYGRRQSLHSQRGLQ